MNQQVSQKLRDDIDGLPGSTACRDAQGVYQYVNAAYGRLMGLTQPLDIVGRTVFDLPCDAAACAEAFQEHDRLVMSSGRAQKVLDIHPYADGQWGVYVVSKKPWFNERREIIGTLCRGVEITDAYTMAISTQLAKFTGHRQDSYLVSDDGGSVSLSPRESEVLFLILRGKTAKLAAAVMGLSYRTVQQYIDLLKAKFQAGNKIELIDVAMARGYMNHIPVSIFSNQLSIVLAAQ